MIQPARATRKTDPVSSYAFTGTLAAAGIRISMDGRSRLDRQRLHRTAVALTEVRGGLYLEGYADGREACAGIAAWIAFYNGRRPHQALGNRTPMAI